MVISIQQINITGKFSVQKSIKSVWMQVALVLTGMEQKDLADAFFVARAVPGISPRTEIFL